MGAKVGIGTVIAVFGIGTIMEYTFRILHFNVKEVKHEDFADTIRRIRSAVCKNYKEKPQEESING